MKEFTLVYSDHIRAAFEVYSYGSRKLLGHITFCIDETNAGDFCYTAFGEKTGKPHRTIKEALEEYYGKGVSLHYSTSKVW
jgi:hypothetical protein